MSNRNFIVSSQGMERITRIRDTVPTTLLLSVMMMLSHIRGTRWYTIQQR